LAEENRRQAVRARALAAKARSQAALLGELATFNASIEFLWIAYEDRARFRKLKGNAPRSLITASCHPARCRPFRHRIRGAEAQDVSIATVVGASLPTGTRVNLIVSRPHVVAQRRVYVVRPRRVVIAVSERCRPAGSDIPASVVTARCP
jgi:hypothetical protein